MTTLFIEPGTRVKAFTYKAVGVEGVYEVLGIGKVVSVISRNMQRAHCIVQLEASKWYKTAIRDVTVDVADHDVMVHQEPPKEHC